MDGGATNAFPRPEWRRLSQTDWEKRAGFPAISSPTLRQPHPEHNFPRSVRSQPQLNSRPVPSNFPRCSRDRALAHLAPTALSDSSTVAGTHKALYRIALVGKVP